MKPADWFTSFFFSPTPDIPHLDIDDVMRASGQEVLARISFEDGHFKVDHNRAVAFTEFRDDNSQALVSTVSGYAGFPIDLGGKTVDQFLCDSEYVVKNGNDIEYWCDMAWSAPPAPSEFIKLVGRGLSWLLELLPEVKVPLSQVMEDTGEEVLAWIEEDEVEHELTRINPKVARLVVPEHKASYLISQDFFTFEKTINTEGKTVNQFLCDSNYVVKSGTKAGEWCAEQRKLPPLPPGGLAGLMQMVLPKREHKEQHEHNEL